MDFSVYVNQKPTSNHGFDGIQKRTRMKWVEDTSVTCCYKCKSEFGWFNRIHHCRNSGDAFCGACTTKRAIIPLSVPIPEPTYGTNEGRDPTIPLRVCDDCFIKLHQLRKVHDCPKDWKTFTAFIEWVSDIRDLKRISGVCREWNKIASCWLSRFKELQYQLPGIPFLYQQRDMLWANRSHFPGHSKWMMQLIRSVQYQTTDGLGKITELKRLIALHLGLPPRERMAGDAHHWNLMCARSCRSNNFSFEEIVGMLDESVPNESIREIIVGLITTTAPELLDYIGYFVHHMSTADCAINESVIGRWLLRVAASDITIANEVYWEMTTRSGVGQPFGHLSPQSSRNMNMYKYWLEKWVDSMPSDIVTKVHLGRTFANGCNTTVGGSTSSKKLSSSSSSSSRSGSAAPNAAVQSFFRKTDAVVCPTNITMDATKIDFDNVKVMQSITRPVKIPFVTAQSYSVLWKPEDIRKDHIVMCFIRVCDRILKRELGEDFHIVTYNVRPVCNNAGFIEMVPDCTTLYDMDASNMFNYVTGDQKMEDLRDRFMRSCAAYSTLTYLLGAGDRHLHNIMLTRDAKLFHIDYGYVMGADPKKRFGGLTRVPDMRIDQNIVTLLGAPENFQRFKNMVDEIYNCLRRHVEPLSALLRLLVVSEPPIHVQTGFTEKKLMKEIITRFAPGENHEQARIQIINRIDNSTRSTTHYALVDVLHHQAQTNGVIRVLSSGWHSLRTSFF